MDRSLTGMTDSIRSAFPQEPAIAGFLPCAYYLLRFDLSVSGSADLRIGSPKTVYEKQPFRKTSS
jgi:hypothetical protein